MLAEGVRVDLVHRDEAGPIEGRPVLAGGVKAEIRVLTRLGERGEELLSSDWATDILRDGTATWTRKGGGMEHLERINCIMVFLSVST